MLAAAMVILLALASATGVLLSIATFAPAAPGAISFCPLSPLSVALEVIELNGGLLEAPRMPTPPSFGSEVVVGWVGARWGEMR